MDGGEVDEARIDIAIALIERDGLFLIGQRPETTSLAGYWEFPGGKVEPGESIAEAARRECREEAALDVRAGETYATTDFDYEHARVRLHFVRCQAERQREPLPTRFRWVRGAELDQYRFPPANAAVVARLVAEALGG